MKLPLLAFLAVAAISTPVAAQSFFDDVAASGTFYAGVIGGVTAGSVAGYYAGAGPLPPAPPAAVAYNFSLHPTGLSFGVFGGYEIPWDRFVLRIEGDAAFVAGATQTYIYPLDTTRHDTVSIHGTGHVRGIVGMPVGQFTPFIAAGIGVAGVTASHQGPVTGGTQTWTQSTLYVGPSVGVGTDIDLGNGMKARLEVLGDFFASRHYDWDGTGARYSDILLSIFTARAGVTIPF